MSRVVLIKTTDRVAGTRKAIDLLQPDHLVGKTIFLKPNYNTADPVPAATDTRLLEALIQELQNAKAGQITIGDGSGMADTREAMTRKGVFQLAERYTICDADRYLLHALGYASRTWKFVPIPLSQLLSFSFGADASASSDSCGVASRPNRADRGSSDSGEAIPVRAQFAS
ncbi:DUF362 domain-containing protein [Cyanobacteria bacterium FACHB-63]|nr:DUF362 domain-containing protein [Cyanobacteria bacterium FACHB-63]